MYIINWILKIVARFFNFLLDLTYKDTEMVVNKKARVDTHAAVQARVRLKRRRRILKTIYELIVVFVLSDITFIILRYYFNIFNCITAFVLACSALATFCSIFVNDIGNISDLEISDVIAYNFPYALYLRSFESDQKQSIFNEEDIVQPLLDQDIVTFTVGFPEEIDTYSGAKRVYVNNDTWQEDVHWMMEHASYIFLRICNTKSCLWEIMQALSLNKELYIIIDSAENYAAVCDQYDGLPQNITLDSGMYSIYKRGR